MARRRYVLTPALQHEIVAFVAAGGYPHVAAEAVGIPRRVFAQWLARGERSPATIYGELARAVCQAHARARLQAEITVREDKPLDWLKCGPGRETADAPGWTSAGRAPTQAVEGPNTDQLCAELFARLGACVDRLDAQPDVRVKLASLMAELHRKPPVSGLEA
jgi:hypothetical protein